MTYTYKCPKCGEFDIEQSMKDNPIEKCPTCDSEVARVYKANINLNFKGSYNSTR